MKNILKIFIDDVKRIRKNVIAMIVVIGVLVVPCLYAWFNIAASWDPYNNTGNLKVAVASVDEGYTGSLIPLEINVGEQVISALRENTSMMKISKFPFRSEANAILLPSGDQIGRVS